MPIQAYVDETGNDGRSPVFLFSALIAPADKWAGFSDRWEACLKASPRIRYLKMDEAEGRSKEFRGFTVVERDAKVKQLCQVLNALRPIEVSSGMDMVGFENT